MATKTEKMTAHLRNMALILTAALSIIVLSCAPVNALSYSLVYLDDGTGAVYDEEQCCYVDMDTYHGAYGYVYDESYGAYVYYNGDSVIICDCTACGYMRAGNVIIIPDDGSCYSDGYCEISEDDLSDADWEEDDIWYENEGSVDDEVWNDEDPEEVVDWVDEEPADDEAWTVEDYGDGSEETVIRDETDEYSAEEPALEKAESTRYTEDDKVEEIIETENTRSTDNKSNLDGYGVAEVAPADIDETDPAEYSVADSPEYAGTESTEYAVEEPMEYDEGELIEYSLADSTDYDMDGSIDYDVDGSTGLPNTVNLNKAERLMSLVTMALGGIAALVTMIVRKINYWR